MAMITGRCWLSVNGALLNSKPGAKLMGVGQIKRTGVAGSAQVVGYYEGVEIPQIEATLSHTADLSLPALAAIRDATVTFETDTGRMYVLQHAWVSGSVGVASDGGDVSVTFQGHRIDEM